MNQGETYMQPAQLKHVVITGGAGYIGSLLTGELLRLGMKVTVIDDLIYGGESLMAYLAHPNFHFAKANVIEPRAVRSSLRSDWEKPSALVHLAAIVGFPACQSVGRQVAWRYNVEATERVFEQAVQLGVEPHGICLILQQLWSLTRWSSLSPKPPLSPLNRCMQRRKSPLNAS